MLWIGDLDIVEAHLRGFIARVESHSFAPYLSAARLTGEVRKDLDIEAAGEWFARILFSLFSTPSSTLDMDDPEVAAEFVRTHVVSGFASDRPRPRRG